jgi:rod shape-determining protein MreD
VRRTFSWTILVLTALLLQSVVFGRLELAGAKPELIYLLAILSAYLEGPASGALTGFFGGMAQDFLLNQPKGITALTLTLMGYAVGSIRQYLPTPSPLLPVLLVAGATAVGVLFNGMFLYLIGRFDAGFAFLLRTAVLSAVYNAILTPLVFPVVRRMVEGSRPRKVFRW